MANRKKNAVDEAVEYLSQYKINIDSVLNTNEYTPAEKIQIKERVTGKPLSYEEKYAIDPTNFPLKSNVVSFQREDDNFLMPGVEDYEDHEETEEEPAALDSGAVQHESLNFDVPSIAESETKAYKLRRFRSGLIYKIGYRMGFWNF